MVQLTQRVKRSLPLPSGLQPPTGARTARGSSAANDFLSALMLETGGGESFGFMHPVRWMRRSIWLLGRFAPPEGKKRQLAYGAAAAVVIPAAFTALAQQARQRAEAGGTAAGSAVRTALLKSTFEVRGPMGQAGRIREALEQDDAATAELELRTLSRHRVDERIPTRVIAAAAAQAVADRNTDAFLTPWLAYAIGGLPAAFAYRALSTLDDELGYRKGHNGMTGAPAAGLTDLTGFVPGRIGTALIAVAAVLWREDAGAAVRALGRPTRDVPGGAAGATAKALHLRHYGRPREIKRTVRIQWTVAVMAAGLTYGALYLRERLAGERLTPPQ